MKPWQVVVLVCMLSFLLTSCGSNNTADTEEDSVLQEQENNGTELENSEETAQEANTDSQGDLKIYLNKDPTRQVTYFVESNDPDQLQSSVLTHYMQDVSNQRIDLSTDEAKTKTLLVNGASSACYNIGGDWACDDGDLFMLQFETKEQEILSNTPDYTITTSATRSIAGARASCFTARKDLEIISLCFSEEGIPLYSKVEEGPYVTIFHASTFSLEVESTVFSIP